MVIYAGTNCESNLSIVKQIFQTSFFFILITGPICESPVFFLPQCTGGPIIHNQLCFMMQTCEWAVRISDEVKVQWNPDA